MSRKKQAQQRVAEDDGGSPAPKAHRFRVAGFEGASRESGQGRAWPGDAGQRERDEASRLGSYPAPGGSMVILEVDQVVDAHVVGWEALDRMKSSGVQLEPIE